MHLSIVHSRMALLQVSFREPRARTPTPGNESRNSWESTYGSFNPGSPLGISRSWIPSLPEGSFEEFCKKYAFETNLNLIDPAARNWLVKEYGLAAAYPKGEKV